MYTVEIVTSADVSAHRPTKWTDTMLNKDNFILVECSFDLNSCASYAFFSFLLRKHTIGTGTNILAHRRLEGNIWQGTNSVQYITSALKANRNTTLNLHAIFYSVHSHSHLCSYKSPVAKANQIWFIVSLSGRHKKITTRHAWLAGCGTSYTGSYHPEDSSHFHQLLWRAGEHNPHNGNT